MSYNGSGKADPLSFSLNVAYLLEKSERKFVMIVDFLGSGYSLNVSLLA